MSEQLRTVARTMVGGGRGILAADESVTTMNKRLDKVGVEQTPENRVAYREMLITTPGLSQWISGVILSDDVFRSHLSDGRPFPQACRDVGIMPGIKVDTGAKPLANAAGETVTEGLDNLRARFQEYRAAGATFSKWRAVIDIGEGLPTPRAIAANAHAMARYAALAQEAGIVPIVEPEVLMDGDHSIERCAEVTEVTHHVFFSTLVEQGILLEGIVLKPNMVVSGVGAPRQAGVEEVAQATVAVLKRTVPAAVPGVAFLSGGQADDVATAHLSAMNRLGPLPWELSFSFGRALVNAALEAWRGLAAQAPAGQEALAARASANAMARAA